MLFCDASAWVKRYVDEPRSFETRHRIAAADHLALARTTEIETISGLCRRWREGALAIDDRDRVLSRLRNDLGQVIVVELTAPVVARATALLLRHALRAADAIQLASALFLRDELGGEMPFLTADERLAAAARSEGFGD